MSRVIALVMAGGGGTRLWPASVDGRPKQLLDPKLKRAPAIAGVGPHPESLLWQTIERVHDVVDQTWIVTTEDQRTGIETALPQFDTERLLLEPHGKNTAPCVGFSLLSMLGSGSVSQDDAIVILPADHHIADVQPFRRLLRVACDQAINTRAIVTLGIAPNHPSTGFGYIHRASQPRPDVREGVSIYDVRRFVEKPDAALAREFVRRGDHLWNSGIFVCHAGRLADEFRRLCPNMWTALEPVRTAAAQHDKVAIQAAAHRAYATIKPAAIDVAVMEKMHDLQVIEARVGWCDLGSWQAVFELCEKNDQGNAIVYTGPRPVVHDSRDCLVWAEHAQVGIAGLTGVAVVVSGGQVLVCPLDRTQDVRSVVDTLRHDRDT